jgi:hypothetical protein
MKLLSSHVQCFCVNLTWANAKNGGHGGKFTKNTLKKSKKKSTGYHEQR